MHIKNNQNVKEWGMFVFVFDGNGDGTWLEINSSIIFVTNSFHSLISLIILVHGSCFSFVSPRAEMSDKGSSSTCVTTSRCYLQLKSLSGRQ